MTTIKSIKFRKLAISSAISIAISTQVVNAQEDQTEEPEKSKSVFEVIEVNASKRIQSIQKVPTSVTAFSGDDVKNLGFQSETQVISQSAGVTLNDYGAAPSIRIRGVGADTFSETVESSAAVYRDDVYRPTMAANNSQLFDIERVEVLRGPQGTLYGRNTNAGLIHFTSARPTDDLEYYAEAQVGSFGQFVLEGALSGGLSESVRGRISFKSNTDDGYQKNLGTGGGDNFGSTDVQAVRGQLEIDISDTANLRIIASTVKQRNIASIYNMRGLLDEVGDPCSPADVLANKCYAYAPDDSAPGGIGVTKVDNPNAKEGYSEASSLANNLDATDFSANFTWEVADNIELVSITAFEKIERYYEEDTDASDGGLLFGFDEEFNPLFFQAAASFGLEGQTFSQELRFAGYGDTLNWIAGAYYFDDDKGKGDFLVTNSIPEFGLTVEANVITKSTALFGQADLEITDSVTLTGGLRYTDDERTAEVRTPWANFVFGLPTEADFLVESQNWTYKIGAQWQGDDIMVYGNHSTGVKSGEFNVNFIASAIEAAPVGEEKVSSFEVGAKWTFADGLGRLNASAFYNDIEDYQATVYEQPPGGGLSVGYFRNIGDVVTAGGELELFIMPVDNLDVMLAVSLLNTKISSDQSVTVGAVTPDSGYTAGTTYAIDGNEMVQAPKVALNGIVRYAIPTQSMGEFAVQTDFSWQDDVFLDVANDPYNVQKAHALVNFRITWASDSDEYYAQLFVENATDKFYASEAFTPEGFDRQGIIAGKPRTFGLKVGTRF